MGRFPKLFGDVRGSGRGDEPARREWRADLGDWGELIRDLAGHDPGRFAEVRGWLLSDALSAFEARLRERALIDYRHEQLLYSFGGLKAKPKLPRILERQ